MIIGSMRVRLLIHDSNSLKDKRSVIKRVTNRLRSRYNCAVGEVGDQNIWRSAILAIVTVYSEKAQAESLFEAVNRELDSFPEFEVIERDLEYL